MALVGQRYLMAIDRNDGKQPLADFWALDMAAKPYEWRKLELEGEGPPLCMYILYGSTVLQLLKSTQMQHGLRFSDYAHYRKYCTARLRRLYKSLKFTHGRLKYTKRPISVATVTVVREMRVIKFQWCSQISMVFTSQLDLLKCG